MREEVGTEIEHCKDLMKTLVALEEALGRFESLKTEYAEEIQRKIDFRATLMAFVLPVFAMFLYLTDGFVFLDDRFLNFSILQIFIGTFIVSFSSWALGIFLNDFFKKMLSNDLLPLGKKSLTKQLFPKYSRKRNQLVFSVEKLLNCKYLRDTPLPEKYMNIKSLAYIIDVLRTEETTSLKEAIDLLDLELKNSRVKNTMMDRTSILRAEEIVNRDMSQHMVEEWLEEQADMN